MTLSKQYSIATRHQRSTRIDSDLSADFFPGLVYHGTAQASLETLFRQYGQTGQSAYTLTGAYGSGKSTVALLMAGLLHADSGIRSAAIDTINTESQSLLEESAPTKRGGYKYALWAVLVARSNLFGMPHSERLKSTLKRIKPKCLTSTVKLVWTVIAN